MNPPRNRKGGAGNPPPKGARASALPDTLAMPEILIPEHDEMEVNALRPLFDNVWNTFGFWGSFKYDDARERHRLGR